MGRIIPFWRNGGRSSAFEACVTPHLDRMWRLALRLRRNPADAEDLVQDLLLRAWRHRDEVLALDLPGPWLARVLYRLHVDRWRRRGALGMADSLDLPDAPDLPDPGSVRPVLAAATHQEILEAIESLPEAQRVAILMHDAEGYSLEEISRIQEVPVGTLKSRLHRGRAAVRAALADGTEDGTGSGASACQVDEDKNHELSDRPA